MRAHHRSRRSPSLSFVLLLILLSILWLAGGASRADVLGQAIVRGMATLLLVAAALLSDRPAIGRLWPVAALLLATIALPLLQLIPLPPVLWTSLPGREPFEQAATLSDQLQPWRPWSIAPDTTANAAASLIVPFTTLVLILGMREDERARLPLIVLVFVTLAMLVGLLQFSGAGFNNPFVNDTPGQVSGIFANRNHLGLLLAFGCLIAPAWAFADRQQARWRAPVAVGLVVLLVLSVLATGSRAGLGLGGLAIALGIALAWRDIGRTLRRYPRWIIMASGAGIVALLLVSIILSVAADRAVAINRVLAVDAAGDIRSLARPTVMTMIGMYFPVGAGLGGFETLFRVHEPFSLLKLTYFNHAHNDFLEIAVDAGLPGLTILAAALGWWGWASARAWCADRSDATTMARQGSGLLLLVILASAFDYPARTPTIMALVVLAATWLCETRPRNTG